MSFEVFDMKDFRQLMVLMRLYKQSIGEEDLSEDQMNRLSDAIDKKQIVFFVGKDHGKIISMCSVCITFSTFSCDLSGIFEDFYILKECRHQGIARAMVIFVLDYVGHKNVKTLWVGCADTDLDMYKSLGFSIKLGNLLTWSGDGTA